jgi:succinate dehydrogenase hydrophobic membrane anchor protein
MGLACHWRAQRASAVLLSVFTIAIVVSLWCSHFSAVEVVTYAQTLKGSFLLGGFLLVGLMHGYLGLQVVIEDYLKGCQLCALKWSRFVFYVISIGLVASWVSVLSKFF